MKPSLIHQILASLGIIEIKEIEKPKHVSETDPIVAPRRKQREQQTIHLSLNIIIPALGAAALIGILAFSGVFSINTETGSGRQDQIIQTIPNPHGTEREVRAYWQKTVQEMDCIDLKRIIEYERRSVDSTELAFADWEYTNNDKLFPSPRDGCYKETGYLQRQTESCKPQSSNAFGCNDSGYFFPRTKDSDGKCFIHFPSDWFYIDPLTKKKFEDPNEFLATYFDSKCSGDKQ